MRNDLLVGISSALAAVAVAGSANAGIAPTMVDPFTTSQSYSTSSSSWTTITGSIFDQRNARAYANAGGTGVSGTNNNVDFTFARGGFSPSTMSLNYQMSGAAAKDLSSIAEMSIVLSGLNLNVAGGIAATGVNFEWTLIDSSGRGKYAIDTRSTNGTSIFNFASATETDYGFDLTQVKTLSLRVRQVGGWNSNSYSTTSSSGTLSNFNYTAVPAPGAAALVGLAGLMARRRRA